MDHHALDAKLSPLTRQLRALGLAAACLGPLGACSAGFTGLAATGVDSANGSPDWATAPSTPAGMSFGTTDSGTKGLQRLDAVAFDNTVHDLTGTEQTPAHDNFPQENRFNNLDNVGSSLVLSAAVQSAWLQAAGELGDEVAKSADDADARTKIYLKVAPCAATDGVEQASCLRQTVQSFGLRAWRRPLSDDEVTTVTQIATSGGSDLPSQVGTAVSTLLSSPFFFFRVEVDPNPGSVAVHALNPYEVATRLSYFLWRSCPDDALLAAAKSGALMTDAGLSAQVPRMLADPRANTLVSSFARQWLGVDSFDGAVPDPNLFPNFTTDVRQSMNSETQAFLADYMLRGAPLGQMLTANYSYLDNTLATYYGVPAPNSDTPVRTALPTSSGRAGLLSQGSMLVGGSTGTKSSPVKRGLTVLRRVLCQPIGAPPNGVSLSPAVDPNAGPMTQRQSLAEHASNPVCASCHVEMDAAGFAFEGFSGSGEKRSLDNNLPIDASGTFDQVKFTNNLGLVPTLATDPRFGNCATKMLFVYGIGRPTTDDDEPTLTGLTELWSANKQSVPVLIQQIVLSQAFRSRHG